MTIRQKLNLFIPLSLLVLLVIIFAGLPDFGNTDKADTGSTIGWNTNNDQLLILECINSGIESASISVNILNSLGDKSSTEKVVVPANGSTHLILKDLLPKNSYGNLKVSSTNSLSNCALVTYKLNEDDSVKYASSVTSSPILSGDSFGIFNSMSVSGSKGELVVNWLTVVNEGTNVFNATIGLYEDGLTELSQSIPLQLNPGERRDIELVLEGSKQGTGVYKISTSNNITPYKASLNRYTKSQGAQYNSNIILNSSAGYMDSGVIPASTMDDSMNWLEIANLSELNSSVVVHVLSQTGEILKVEEYSLSAMSTKHLFVNEIIGENSTGSLRVVSSNAKILVNSLVYGSILKDKGWASSFYSSRKLHKNKFIFSYNTNLGVANWLKVFSVDHLKPLAVRVKLYNGNGEEISLSDKSHLTVGGSKDIAIHEIVGENQFGRVEIESDEEFRSDLVRVFNKESIIGLDKNTEGGQLSSMMAVPDLQGLINAGGLNSTYLEVDNSTDNKGGLNFTSRKVQSVNLEDTATYIKECKAKGIDVPVGLPDISDNNPLNGWKFVGKYSGEHGEVSISTVGNSFSLYTYSSGNTLCYYAPRYTLKNNNYEGRNSNGVLCYNIQTCQVCALEKMLNRPNKQFDPKQTSELESLPKQFDPCSSCHTQGPLFTNKASYNDIGAETTALMNTCASRCGPAWIGGSPSTNGCGDKSRALCPPQKGCDSCHAKGWVKWASEDMVKVALDPHDKRNGSMRDHALEFPKSCWNFAECMGFEKERICPDQTFNLEVKIVNKNNSDGQVQSSDLKSIDCPTSNCTSKVPIKSNMYLFSKNKVGTRFQYWEGPCLGKKDVNGRLFSPDCRLDYPMQVGKTIKVTAVFDKVKENFPSPVIIAPKNKEVVTICNHDAKWEDLYNTNGWIAPKHIIWFAEITKNSNGVWNPVANTIQTSTVDGTGSTDTKIKTYSLKNLKDRKTYRFAVASCGNQVFTPSYADCENPKWTMVDFTTKFSKPCAPSPSPSKTLSSTPSPSKSASRAVSPSKSPSSSPSKSPSKSSSPSASKSASITVKPSQSATKNSSSTKSPSASKSASKSQSVISRSPTKSSSPTRSPIGTFTPWPTIWF